MGFQADLCYPDAEIPTIRSLVRLRLPISLIPGEGVENDVGGVFLTLAEQRKHAWKEKPKLS